MTTGSVNENAVRRTCRRVGLDRNPMRRREDRLQEVIAVVLTVLFLIMIPVAAMTIGGRVYETETRAAQAEAAQLHTVDATVVEVGQTPIYAPVTPTKVEWHDSAGTAHTSDYTVTGIVKPGGTVTVWVNNAGKVVEPPSATRAISKAVVVTTVVGFAVLALFGGCYFGMRRGLDRRRSRLWETEWATVGLTWGNHGTRPDQS
ncbi:Rv1733c family protein [Nocardia australiensis]|uniref:Rv1733c family protein n=1 Tax=Nocardia australiensis TaxID=2887191 RepID=UPI001D13F5F1|nr:hypothetical protein [Nocardia australiensis]